MTRKEAKRHLGGLNYTEGAILDRIRAADAAFDSSCDRAPNELCLIDFARWYEELLSGYTTLGKSVGVAYCPELALLALRAMAPRFEAIKAAFLAEYGRPLTAYRRDLLDHNSRRRDRDDLEALCEYIQNLAADR
jgi:hypothetical protein